jgi:hypothetical protein
MAHTDYKGLLNKVLLAYIMEQDSVLAMLEWVAPQMMQIEAQAKVGLKKENAIRNGKHTFQEIAFVG